MDTQPSIVPVLMVRNEEYWIQHVLRPLAAVFPRVIVGDTGSTDATPALAREIAGVQVLELGQKTPEQLAGVRQTLGDMALRYGYPWCLLVDGDELYCEATLRKIVADLEGKPPEKGRLCGFVKAVHVDGKAPIPDPSHESTQGKGELWQLADLHHRHAIFRSGAKWIGEYPFEGVTDYNDPSGYFYLEPPAGYEVHEYHLHRLARSSQDDRVYMRQEKQFQFCLADRNVARVKKVDLAAWMGDREYSGPESTREVMRDA